jgi:hypothetical protein
VRFNLDGAGPIISIQLVNDYIIAVYETIVRVYKTSTGDMLQELGRLDTTGPNKFKYKIATLNAAESSELVLLA